MVETARRKYPHMLCFKCNEEADAAFSRLATYLGMPKGELFIKMMSDYKARCIENDEVFFAKHKSTQQELLDLFGRMEDAYEKTQDIKRGRPAGADQAAPERDEDTSPVA